MEQITPLAVTPLVISASDHLPILCPTILSLPLTRGIPQVHSRNETWLPSSNRILAANA